MKWNRCTFTVWPWQDLRPFFLSERRALFSTWFLTPCNLERNAWDGRRETFVDFWAGVEGLVPWNYQKVVSWVEAQVSSDCNGRELGFSSWSILTSSKVWATPCVTHPLLQTFLLWFVGIGTFEHHFAKKNTEDFSALAHSTSEHGGSAGEIIPPNLGGLKENNKRQ